MRGERASLCLTPLSWSDTRKGLTSDPVLWKLTSSLIASGLANELSSRSSCQSPNYSMMMENSLRKRGLSPSNYICPRSTRFKGEPRALKGGEVSMEDQGLSEKTCPGSLRTKEEIQAMEVLAEVTHHHHQNLGESLEEGRNCDSQICHGMASWGNRECPKTQLHQVGQYHPQTQPRPQIHQVIYQTLTWGTKGNPFV